MLDNPTAAIPRNAASSPLPAKQRMSTSLSIFFLVQQTYRLVTTRVEEALEKEGMTARHFLLLDLLASHEPCSSADLARLACMTAQAMGESVKALEKRGLLDKTGSPDDGRTLLIRRSALGWETYIRCNRAVQQAEVDFFSCLPPMELARVRGSLALVRELEVARRQADE
ncbi:MarR family transcriptional regulator [Paraburkholderia sacchari]